MAEKDRELFGCTLQGVAERVSYALGDLNNDGSSKGRYLNQYLCAMVGDAIRVLAELKREDFVDQITFDIDPGECVQTLPEDCASFLEFICFVDKTTKEQFPVFDGITFAKVRKLSVLPMANHCGSEIQSFKASFSPNSSRVFAITPQIPGDRPFEAIALCSVVDEIVGDFNADLPTVIKPLIPALVALTANMLLMADVGDPTAQSIANQYMNQLTTFLQITVARVAAAQAAAAT